ncbi:MAG: hypothetical protein QXO75_12200 [Nitrososphaerota archaeon]
MEKERQNEMEMVEEKKKEIKENVKEESRSIVIKIFDILFFFYLEKYDDSDRNACFIR